MFSPGDSVVVSIPTDELNQYPSWVQEANGTNTSVVQSTPEMTVVMLPYGTSGKQRPKYFPLNNHCFK